MTEPSKSNFLWDADPPAHELVLSADGETLVSLELAAELADTEDDELMVEARKLDDEDDEDDNAARACLTRCANRHVRADQEPCLSCDVASLSNYRAETEVTDASDDALTAEARRLDEQDHDEDWAADDPDDL